MYQPLSSARVAGYSPNPPANHALHGPGSASVSTLPLTTPITGVGLRDAATPSGSAVVDANRALHGLGAASVPTLPQTTPVTGVDHVMPPPHPGLAVVDVNRALHGPGSASADTAVLP